MPTKSSKKSTNDTKKRIVRQLSLSLHQRKRLTMLSFVLVFAGIGVYFIIRSYAATGTADGVYPARCTNQTWEIPGGGTAVQNPVVIYVPPNSRSGKFSNSVIVAVRGTNPGSSIYYQTLDLDNLAWSGRWESLGGASVGYLGLGAYGNIFVSVVGTDGNWYEQTYQNSAWTGWRLTNQYNLVANQRQPSTSFRSGGRTYSLATSIGTSTYNRGKIYYRCT